MLSYWFLTAYPLWITVPILYFLTVGILLPIRRVFEGRAYNHSFASEYGDLALIMVIMIGAGILERMNHVNAIMATTGFHMIIGLAAISIGLYWASREQWGPAGDMFHNLVSVPILIYFLCTVVPATWDSATTKEKLGMDGFLVIWAILVEIDRQTGRKYNPEYEALHFH